MESNWALEIARNIADECFQNQEKTDDNVISQLAKKTKKNKKKRKRKTKNKKEKLDPELKKFIQDKAEDPDAECEAPFWLQSAIDVVNQIAKKENNFESELENGASDFIKEAKKIIGDGKRKDDTHSTS